MRPCPKLTDAIIATTDPEGCFDGAELGAWTQVRAAARLARLGCDAYAYAMVAAGTMDLVVEAGLKAWDIEARHPGDRRRRRPRHRLARRSRSARTAARSPSPATAPAWTRRWWRCERLGEIARPARRPVARRRRDRRGQGVELPPEHRARVVGLHQDFVEGAGDLDEAALGQVFGRRGALRGVVDQASSSAETITTGISTPLRPIGPRS